MYKVEIYENSWANFLGAEQISDSYTISSLTHIAMTKTSFVFHFIYQNGGDAICDLGLNKDYNLSIINGVHTLKILLVDSNSVRVFI